LGGCPFVSLFTAISFWVLMLVMVVGVAELTEELGGLEFVHARELDREVREGAYHTGVASVVQIVGLRPHTGRS
jgi:hypothetical protein